MDNKIVWAWMTIKIYKESHTLTSLWVWTMRDKQIIKVETRAMNSRWKNITQKTEHVRKGDLIEVTLSSFEKKWILKEKKKKYYHYKAISHVG